MDKKITSDGLREVGPDIQEANFSTHEHEKGGHVLAQSSRNRGHKTGLVEGYLKYLPLVWFGFSLQCAWEATGFGIQLSLANGGAASLVYGTLLGGAGSFLIALSLGEMASIDPAVGAQYRWSAKFAPAWPEFWGLFQGWITVFAWLASTSANPAYLATGIQALAQLNYPQYEPEAYQTTLIMCATVIPAVVVNLWLRQVITPMEWFGAFGHGVFWIVSMATLAATGTRASHSSVWANLSNGIDGGWQNAGVAFGVGLVPATFPLTSFDGIIHMSKDVRNPKRYVPRAMAFSVALNAVMQFIWLVVVLYYGFGDPEAIANAPGGLAIVGIYMGATKSKAATSVLITFHLIILYVSMFNIMASTARLAWAFSRNKGLPFSKFFSHISIHFRQPVRTLGIVAVTCCVLSVIYIGSTAAFNALISMPLIALYLSYAIPILFHMFQKLNGSTFRPGSFNMGIVPGVIVNATAVAYIIYIIIFAALPTALPVTAANMNYAGPLVLAVILVAAADWRVSGRRRFSLLSADSQGSESSTTLG